MSDQTVSDEGRRGRWGARDLALVAVFAGLTAALGLIPAIYLPFSPIPLTAQTLAVFVTGAILGPRRGLAAQLLFMALIALGLPLLSGFRGGLAVFVGPTVGFFLAFPVVAALVGWLTYRVGAPYRLWWGVVTHVIGMVVIDAMGVVGMMIVAHLSLVPALVGGVLPFLIGDSIKCVLAALVAKGVHTGYPGLLPARSWWGQSGATAKDDAKVLALASPASTGGPEQPC
jgi:biotin transport system substrate-specific component